MGYLSVRLASRRGLIGGNSVSAMARRAPVYHPARRGAVVPRSRGATQPLPQPPSAAGGAGDDVAGRQSAALASATSASLAAGGAAAAAGRRGKATRATS